MLYFHILNYNINYLNILNYNTQKIVYSLNIKLQI